ncbi:ParB N-terminal domain-containing protein [Pikeienuella piscinae]|uniref:ParB N-terminal domain-containing protein n=1 Tax=Pikeienuella piscinae TaxID=2748098 RepID=A0A7L5C0E9_9RHOB|nr:ParB N-terminal domain-containing protein [Pikeienuella piscinae]QIE56227.1 ParB N-terminal domain-containing protein [Pikeienuella piscinae]
MKQQTLPLKAIRVPAKRARTLEAAKVAALAEDILENGLTTPILVRADGEGYVLVEGLHRLEAAKALGEETIEGILVQARRW